MERTDGQVFIGTITSVRNGQVQIRIRQGSGYTDLLIDSAKIRSARIYPE
ncbi:MAG: putative component of toxin-antitoxin plasmid stabilization module [Reinekea sp.]